MITTRNCACLPLCEYVRDTVPDDVYLACLSDLVSASNRLATVSRGRPQPTFPSIEVLESNDSRLPTMQLEPNIQPERFLMISNTDFVDDQKPPGNFKKPLSAEERLSYNLNAAHNDIRDFAIDLIIAANIAYPGVIEVFSGHVFQNEKVVKSVPTIQSDLYYAVETAQKKKWPPITNLGIRDTWTWMTADISLVERFAETEFGTAISAFTYLLGEHQWSAGTILDLFWSMIGLEALYGKGSAEISSQLVEKTQALLGIQIDFKRDVKRMYHYRSRLVHGDIKVPSAFFEYLDMKFDDEVSKYAHLAAAILVSTLQAMCRRNVHALGFDYVLRDASAKKGS